jgi:tetratricopeptide (TPR) repeat protein
MTRSLQAVKSLLTYLTRLSQRNPRNRAWLEQALTGRLAEVADAALDIAIETGDPLGRVLEEQVERSRDIEVLDRLSARCGEGATLYSVPLQELAETVTRRLIDLGSADSLAERERKIREAWLFVDLGNRLSAQGDYSQAITAARDSVRIFRELVSVEPEVFLGDLALALRNLGDALADLQSHREALEVTLEAIDIGRRLADRRPDLFRSDLANGLDGLGIRLYTLGRWHEALQAMEEGIKLQQGLPPDQFESSWKASSRLNLALVLEGLGRNEDALALLQEAVDHYRELANDRPDAFTPQLARGLHNLGRVLAALGRMEEALSCSQEATELLGNLATERPWSFIASFARSANQYGLLLARVGDGEDSVEFCEEGVRILGDLAKREPGVYRLDLAKSLCNLASARDFAGLDPTETERVYRRALRILRPLGRERPETCHEDLAVTLSNLASLLLRQGRGPAAIRLTWESVSLYRRIGASEPDLYAPYLAASLVRLGARLERLGRLRAARAAWQEAADLYREMWRRDPTLDRLDVLISALRRLHKLLRRTGRMAAARDVQREFSTCRREKRSMILPRDRSSSYIP